VLPGLSTRIKEIVGVDGHGEMKHPGMRQAGPDPRGRRRPSRWISGQKVTPKGIPPVLSPFDENAPGAAIRI